MASEVLPLPKKRGGGADKVLAMLKEIEGRKMFPPFKRVVCGILTQDYNVYYIYWCAHVIHLRSISGIINRYIG